MEIAVIGWGSLIWCPGSLRIKARWHSDGPRLPLEFARISADGRLTLVIHDGSRRQTTYWALSLFCDLRSARENLKTREGTDLRYIHSLTSDGQKDGDIRSDVSDLILKWLKCHPILDAVVWTGLPSNWVCKRNRRFTPKDALQYVKDLERARDDTNETYERAREYIANAPSQIQTVARRLISRDRGWKDASLPQILFEAEARDEIP